MPHNVLTPPPAARAGIGLSEPVFVFAPGAPGGTLTVHPDFERLFTGVGLTSASAFLGLPGEVVSGHPDRHVARVGVPGAAHAFYLKRQHVIGWKERLRNRLAGFGWTSRCEREAALLQQLAAAHLPAPRWAAYGTLNGRAFLLVEEAAGATDLRRFLSDGTQSRSRRMSLAAQLGEAIEAVHAAGFGTPDLTAKHVLVNPDTLALTFLDWQSAARDVVSEAARANALGALHASLAGALASPRERMWALSAYRARRERSNGHRPRGAVAPQASQHESPQSDLTPSPSLSETVTHPIRVDDCLRQSVVAPQTSLTDAPQSDLTPSPSLSETVTHPIRVDDCLRQSVVAPQASQPGTPQSDPTPSPSLSETVTHPIRAADCLRRSVVAPQTSQHDSPRSDHIPSPSLSETVTHPRKPDPAFTQMILRAAERHARRRSVRDQLQPVSDEEPQRLIWLAGEAVCVVPEIAAAWPRPAIAPPFYGFGPDGASRVRFAGRDAVLLRGHATAPFERVRAWLRASPWRSPGATAGRVLFHLARYGVPGPALLAFGQRLVSATSAEWFVLHETPPGTPLRRWRRTAGSVDRRAALASAAECLEKLHAAGCVLLDARTAFTVEAGRVSVADPRAVRIVRRVGATARRRDLRAVARLLGVE